MTSPNHNSRGSASVLDVDLLDALLINGHLKDLLEEIQYLRNLADEEGVMEAALEHLREQLDKVLDDNRLLQKELDTAYETD